MGATLTVDVNLSGWYAKCDRVKEAIGRIGESDARLEYTGTHSVLHTANSRIAASELARAGGDKNAIFPLEAGDTKKPAGLVAKRLKMVADGASVGSIVEAWRSAVKLICKSVYRNVLADKTTGPARTAAWNAFKAATWRSPTPKMVASREWLNELTATVDGQVVAKGPRG
jgi:hypothetical protein